MWYLLMESITDRLRIVCTVLAFVIPYVVYKLNLKFHEIGDPPWKQNNTQENSEGPSR